MGMVVRSNIMAVNAQRQLGMNNSSVGKALEKLSSGYRINRAGDDASGLAISEKMKAQIKGLDTASLNAQDGVSVVQTAEGALTEVHNMLNRMTELATRIRTGSPFRMKSRSFRRKSTVFPRRQTSTASTCSTARLAAARLARLVFLRSMGTAWAT